jgi:hypothetical protein
VFVVHRLLPTSILLMIPRPLAVVSLVSGGILLAAAG